MIYNEKENSLSDAGLPANAANGLFSKPSFKTWLVLAFAACVYVSGLIINLADPDLWGYLAFGQKFWTNSGFVFQDSFSYMPTNPVWVYHEWLTGVIFYPLYAGFGEASLQLLRYGLALGAIGFAFATALKQGSGLFWAGLGLFFAGYAICPGYSPVRAQVFTYFFFAMCIFICENAKKSQAFSRLWLLVLIFIFWCNVHGGFIAGICVVGLYALGEAISRKKFTPFAAILVLCVFATLINPYGLKYWQYLVKAVTMARPDVTEWMSIWEVYKLGHKQLSVPVFITLAIMGAGLCAWRPAKNKTAILVFLATACMGFLHVRHMVFFGLAFAAYMPAIAKAFYSSFANKKKTAQQWTIIIGIAFAALWLTYINAAVTFWHAQEPNAFSSPLALKIHPSETSTDSQIFYPTGGISYLKQNKMHGNILPDFSWGQFIMWSLPESRVAMDGRYETVYPINICKDYFNFINGMPGWENYIKDYPHEIAIFKPNSFACFLLSNLPDWKIAYADKGCVVLLKTSF